MKKRFWSVISLISIILLEIMPFNSEVAYSSNIYENTTNENLNNNLCSDTFDIKKVIPEVVVIVIAGGVLLFCISKES